TELFNLCAKFAGYGFNKSHSASYALISYQTAYLKANYPMEFMAALLTSVMGNTDKITAYVAEAQRMKIKILPPDINESDRNFTATAEGIRFGLAAIKNVGTAAIEAIIEAKNKGGPFASFYDFCLRVDSRVVNKKVIESLIKSAAFDRFGQSRAWLLANYERIISKVSAEKKEIASGQETLFNVPMADAGYRIPEDSAEEIAEFTPDQLLRMEKEQLGLYISAHPLERLKDSLEVQTNVRIADIPEMKEEQIVKVGGILSNSKRVVTKRGDSMMIADLEDLTGSIPCVIFPKVYERYAPFLNDDQVVVIKGRLNRDFRTDELNVVVEAVEPLEEVEKIRSLHIELVDITDKNVLDRMKEILRFFCGEDPVFISLDGKKVELGKDFRVDINPQLVEELEQLLGTGAVRVEFSVLKRAETEVNF
ncbi:MAG: OB-fold nucleic acid binding domain-containing protein, partial [Candidatus Margulisiibacteriota bacterium]